MKRPTGAVRGPGSSNVAAEDPALAPAVRRQAEAVWSNMEPREWQHGCRRLGTPTGRGEEAQCTRDNGEA